MSEQTASGATIVGGYDVTGANILRVPSGGQLAGYSTGYSGVPWTDHDWALYPAAIRIDQSPAITALDVTCDVLDVENYAGTDAEAPQWLTDARAARARGDRPGQRDPGFYRDLAGRDALADALEAAGFRSGVPLWLAHWGIGRAAAVALLGTVYRCFTIVGVQDANIGPYDTDVWLSTWLDSTGPVPGPQPQQDPTEEIVSQLPIIEQGATGQHVKNAQGLINAHGYHIAVDGIFGPITTAATEQVQRAGWIEVDGIIGPHTWSELLDVS